MTSIDMVALGAAVKEKRQQEGLSLLALSQIVIYDPGGISRIERGRHQIINAALYLRFCKWLGVDPSEFVIVEAEAAA